MSKKSPRQTDVVVGQNVRRYRTHLKMSQTTLANHLGLTFQQVQKYERGLNRIGASRLVRIAEVFGVSIEALFDGVEGLETSSLALPDFRADALSIRLASSFANVDVADLRRSIVNLVEEIAKRERCKKTTKRGSRRKP